MSILKYNPNHLVNVSNRSLFNEILHDNFFSTTSEGSLSFSPQVDISESKTSFEFNLALPGMKKEDIKIDLQEGKLSISGERTFSNENKERNYHSVETKYGAFHRSFQLPNAILSDQTSASYENGILHVIVPKDEKQALAKVVEVK